MHWSRNLDEQLSRTEYWIPTAVQSRKRKAYHIATAVRVLRQLVMPGWHLAYTVIADDSSASLHTSDVHSTVPYVRVRV